MRRGLLGRAREFVPESVKGAIASCGGYDRRGHRFAGHLARPDLAEREFLGICDALILPNGTRKTTGPARNGALIRQLLERRLLVNDGLDWNVERPHAPRSPDGGGGNRHPLGKTSA